MKFEAVSLADALHIEIERKEDHRGFFARTWCRDEFAAHGISIDMVQASISHSSEAGTLRGMHFQWPPSHEAKLVRCERGRIYDVIIDLRPDSRTYTKHCAVTLDDERRNALFVPPGFAHGFQTLVPECDVVYIMSDFYQQGLTDGVRYDDPAFAISWPLSVSNVIERDKGYPPFDQDRHARRYADSVRSIAG